MDVLKYFGIFAMTLVPRDSLVKVTYQSELTQIAELKQEIKALSDTVAVIKFGMLSGK